MTRAVGVKIGVSLASWLIAAAVAPGAAVELALGLALPLGLAVTTSVLVERTMARDPRRLTSLMIKAFGVKMVLVGLYVGIIVGLTALDPVAFIASFCVYFIGWHLAEALQLRSVFAHATS